MGGGLPGRGALARGRNQSGGWRARWRALDDRRRINRVAGSRACYRGSHLGPVSSRVRSVAGARDAVKGFGKTSLRARLWRHTPSAQSPKREADGGHHLGRPVVGQLTRRGVSVSLGRGRHGGARRKGRVPLRASFLRAWSGPQAASSVRQTNAGGALARGGLRLPIGR